MPDDEAAETSGEICRRLKRVEELLCELIEQRQVKELYSTAEVAEIVERAEHTVREWCRHGRVQAMKAAGGRGREWRISHEELQRIRNHGPLPLNHIQSE